MRGQNNSASNQSQSTAPAKFKPGMDTKDFPASALGKNLINLSFPKAQIWMKEKQDFSAWGEGDKMVPSFTTPSPEKIAAGKKPFPYVSFTDENGNVYRVYGNTAVALSNCTFIEGDDNDITAVVEITAEGDVIDHESEL